MRFSHLSARSQSLLAELAPRLIPPELAGRWIVARGRSLALPARLDLRACGVIAPHENRDDIQRSADPKYRPVCPLTPTTTSTVSSAHQKRRLSSSRASKPQFPALALTNPPGSNLKHTTSPPAPTTTSSCCSSSSNKRRRH